MKHYTHAESETKYQREPELFVRFGLVLVLFYSFVAAGIAWYKQTVRTTTPVSLDSVAPAY
jgi:hypothetical protein